MKRINSYLKQKGSSGIAYSLLAGLVAMGVITGITALGGSTGSVLGLASNEMTDAASGTEGSGSQSGNELPTISDISDALISADGVYGPVGFTVSDAETAAVSLSVMGSSSNISLVPNDNITLGGSGESRTITITPAASQSGMTTITVTVDDGTDTSQDSFVLTVNALPTISDIADASIVVDGTYGPTGFVISDAETAAGSLSVTGSSSNTALVPNGNIVFGGSDGSRTLTITPAAGQSGTAMITVTVDDGADTIEDTFVLTVSLAPTISDITDVIISNSASSHGPIAFTVGDSDTDVNTLTLSATSSNQAVAPDGGISFGGSGANRTISLSSLGGSGGQSATITVTVDDGASTAQDSFVVSRNSPPYISNISDVTISANETHGPITFYIGDNETDENSLVITSSTSNPKLIPNGNVSFGGSSTVRNYTFTPGQGWNGLSYITVMVDDGIDVSEKDFLVTVQKPTCSGSLLAGTACDLSGEKVVFISNYDPGDGGGSRPLYAQHCDQGGGSWTGGGTTTDVPQCNGGRSSHAWNNGNVPVWSIPRSPTILMTMVLHLLISL